MEKRMKVSVLMGVILGIVCVIGAYVRSNFMVAPDFVFALWYNRVIIGLVIGAPWKKLTKNKALIRGGIIGLLVSFAFYSATSFKDPISFIAGIVYGIIIEWFLVKKALY